MTKASYRYKSASGEPTLTDRVRIRIETYTPDTEFTIDNFRDIPTNVSSALKKLEAQEEVVFVERRKIIGERYSRNFYCKAVGAKQDRKISFQGWEKVYPEFFTIPNFHIISITKVGEKL